MKYYTYFYRYLRCQIEYIFTLNRQLNCGKTSLKSAKQKLKKLVQKAVKPLQFTPLFKIVRLSNPYQMIWTSLFVIPKLVCTKHVYTIQFSDLRWYFASYFRGLFRHFVLRSREICGFDESLVIQHEMADFCTLIYFLARLKWNII